jgi:hypothetical protein
MTTPKMKTQAPLSPEQIRAIVGNHQRLVAHRRYIRIRTIVRSLFWFTVIGVLAFVVWKTGALDDYTNTCETLQVCQ